MGFININLVQEGFFSVRCLCLLEYYEENVCVSVQFDGEILKCQRGGSFYIYSENEKHPTRPIML